MIHNILFGIMCLFGIACTVSDLKSHMICDYFTVPFALAGIADGFVKGDYIAAIIGILFVVFVFIFPERINGIGDADIILYGGLIGYYGLKGIPAVLIVTNVIALILYVIVYSHTKKHKTEKFKGVDEEGNETEIEKPAVPFAPAILLSLPVLQWGIPVLWLPLINTAIQNISQIL